VVLVSITWAEAGVVGLLQGVTELFPVSSLGHTILLPALIGGRWAQDLSVSTKESPYLAFVVGLHVATAVALLIFFWRDWVRVVRGLATSLRDRRVVDDDQRLGWTLVLATIPVGIAGLLLEHTFRTVLGKPLPAAIFLMVNGVVLAGGELLRRRAEERAGSAPEVPPVRGGGGLATETAATAARSDQRLATMGYGEGTLIGAAQIAALAPGISRSGVTMVAGLLRGLSHEDAARFSFLLATPVILAAGVLKLPDLFGPLGDGIRGQVAFGSILSGSGAYLAVRFLTRYFETRTLIPFAVYSFIAGLACTVYFA